MDASTLRRRTKAAVSNWSSVPIGDILMSSKLEDLSSVDREVLRQRVNQEFSGEHGFPVSGKSWSETALATVSDVRDFVKKRLES